MNLNWLKRDAWNRAWRVILQTVALVVIAPAVDAAVQVFNLAVVDAVAGKGFDWDQVAQTAVSAAWVGASLSVLAYMHRRFVDPSRVPSAEPPTPPAQPRGMAVR